MALDLRRVGVRAGHGSARHGAQRTARSACSGPVRRRRRRPVPQRDRIGVRDSSSRQCSTGVATTSGRRRVAAFTAGGRRRLQVQAAAGYRGQPRQIPRADHRQPQSACRPGRRRSPIAVPRNSRPSICDQVIFREPSRPCAVTPVSGRGRPGDQHPGQRPDRHGEEQPPPRAGGGQRGDQEQQHDRHEQRGCRQPERRAVGSGHGVHGCTRGDRVRPGPARPDGQGSSTSWDAPSRLFDICSPGVLPCVRGTSPRNQLARPRRHGEGAQPLGHLR